MTMAKTILPRKKQRPSWKNVNPSNWIVVSPLLKGVSWTPRSRSTDNLEKYSPVVGRKSPLVKMQTESGADDCNNKVTFERLNIPTAAESKTRSPSNESIKSFDIDPVMVVMGKGATNGVAKTPLMAQKPRPWSVAGNEGKCDFAGDSNKTTPEAIDTGALTKF